MRIDWFTVAAQALNFVILVWLMKRFLYKPVLRAIDEREKRIAAKLADADRKEAEAGKERDEFQRKNEEFDQGRLALFGQAKDEANAERQRLLDQARSDSDALRAKRRGAFEREQQSLKNELTRRTREEVFAIARKTLADLAGTNLEERVSDVFTRRLQELDMETKDSIARALTASSGPALVRSAFDLPAEQQGAIRHALEESLLARIEVRFETTPDLISGIELVANGHKVAWSIADYLASLEKSVGALLEGEPGPEGEPDLRTGRVE